MYNSEETKWFSQALFFYKDKVDGTDSTLRLSTSTGSSDLATFTIPKLSIQIQNHLHKSVNLDIHGVRDLLIGIRENMKRTNPLDGEPTIRRVSLNHELSISFHSPSDPKAKIVIRSNETDFSSVIIPIAKFQTVLKIMEQFVASYITIADGLVLRAISYQLNKLEDINRNIRGLYSRQESQDCIQDNGAVKLPTGVDSESVAATVDLSDQLDKFLGDDMENIKVPEIVENKVEEQKKKTVTEVKSKLLDVFKWDMKAVIDAFCQETSFDALTGKMSSVLDFEVLPGIDHTNFKMITYFTKIFVDLTTSSAVQIQTKIPSGFPMIKYKPSGIKPDNVDLAYDLLLIGAYLKSARSLIENHQSDIFSNLSIEHMKFRMFTDAMIFSLISDKSPEKVLSATMSRYDYYKKLGVFKWFDEKLKSENNPEITKKQIHDYISEVLKNASSKPILHDAYDNWKKAYSLKLHQDNSLNIEQIKNELIPLEIKEKLTQKIEKSDFDGISPEVVDVFKSKKKAATRQLNPIQMFVKKFNVQIPEDQVDKLVDFLEDYSDKKIDFQNFPFQIEDFEETVLKGLYYWDPEKHKNTSTLVQDLDDSMTKDLLLPKIKSGDQVEDKAGFGDMFADIDLS